MLEYYMNVYEENSVASQLVGLLMLQYDDVDLFGNNAIRYINGCYYVAMFTDYRVTFWTYNENNGKVTGLEQIDKKTGSKLFQL